MQVWCTLKFKKVLCSLKFKTCVFFVPVQVWWTLKSNTLSKMCTGTRNIKVLNFKVHQTCTGTKKTKTSQSTWEGATIPLKFLFFFFCFFVPVQVWCTLKFKTFVFFVPVQVWWTLKSNTLSKMCTGTRNIKVLNFKVHQTCAGTKKTKTSQSTWEGATIPLKFLVFFCFLVPVQVWWTLKSNTLSKMCTGTRNIKVLNFKVHQTCTGTKKTKTSQSTWEGATIPLKFLFFFLLFCPCAGLVHFEVQNFCFFCPCAGLVDFEVQHPV